MSRSISGHATRTVGLLAAALVLGACGLGPQDSAQRIDPLDVPNGLLSPPVAVVNSEGPVKFFVYLTGQSPNTGVAPLGRNAARQPRPQEVVDTLLRGPLADEVAVGLRSAIPSFTTARVSTNGPTATIDLGGGILTALTSANEQNIALAQLLFTVTAIEGIERVRFTTNDGIPLSVLKRDLSTATGQPTLIRTTEPLGRTEVFVPGQS